MSDENPARQVADNQTNGNQSQPSEAPRISTNGGNNDGDKNSDRTEKHAEPKKHDALDWATLVVLIFTFAAACAAAVEAKRLADLTYDLVVDGRRIADRQARMVAASIKISSDTMVTNARAWVVPRRLIVTAVLGEPLRLELQYTNVGKEPALNMMVGNTEYIPLDPAILRNPPQAAEQIGINNACKTTVVPPSATTVGETIWPLPEPEERHFAELAGFSNTNAGFVDDDFMNGKRAIVVKGCLGYRTFTEAHFSQFCFVVRGPTDKWSVLDCPAGNSAD